MGVVKENPEQREAAALWKEWYVKKYGDEAVEDEAVLCSLLRKQLLLYADWLHRQAEALQHPVTRWRTLVEDGPALDLTHRGACIKDCVAEAAEIGEACRPKTKKATKKNVSRG
jgi:hypothetical protein